MYYSSQIEAAFTKYDISGDDMLNYKEFCDMIHNREEDKQNCKFIYYSKQNTASNAFFYIDIDFTLLTDLSKMVVLGQIFSLLHRGDFAVFLLPI